MIQNSRFKIQTPRHIILTNFDVRFGILVENYFKQFFLRQMLSTAWHFLMQCFCTKWYAPSSCAVNVFCARLKTSNVNVGQHHIIFRQQLTLNFPGECIIMCVGINLYLKDSGYVAQVNFLVWPVWNQMHTVVGLKQVSRECMFSWAELTYEVGLLLYQTLQQ